MENRFVKELDTSKWGLFTYWKIYETYFYWNFFDRLLDWLKKLNNACKALIEKLA